MFTYLNIGAHHRATVKLYIDLAPFSTNLPPQLDGDQTEPHLYPSWKMFLTHNLLGCLRHCVSSRTIRWGKKTKNINVNKLRPKLRPQLEDR